MQSIKSRDSLDKMMDPFKPQPLRPSPPPNPKQRYLDQLVVSRNHNPTFLNSML